jgi:DMSO/TMAO reductase YedYZ molybdopterin-dependent catalytic subunit
MVVSGVQICALLERGGGGGGVIFIKVDTAPGRLRFLPPKYQPQAAQYIVMYSIADSSMPLPELIVQIAGRDLEDHLGVPARVQVGHLQI